MRHFTCSIWEEAPRRIQLRDTILPAGVGISPPMMSWIKRNSTRRFLWSAGIVRPMKPLATRHSDENSAGVRSFLLGKRSIMMFPLSLLICLDATNFRPAW